jgi:hypothetical protein
LITAFDIYVEFLDMTSPPEEKPEREPSCSTEEIKDIEDVIKHILKVHEVLGEEFIVSSAFKLTAFWYKNNMDIKNGYE